VGRESSQLDISYGLMELPLLSNRRARSASQSSTFSNPASIRGATPGEDVGLEALRNSQGPPNDYQDHDDTYLVEIMSHPCLQFEKERAKILLKGDFDAVLLVYDITSRESFETVAELHNEIPLNARSGRSSLGRRKGWWQTLGHGSDEIVVGLVGNKSDLDGGFEMQDFDLDALLLEKENVTLDDVASEREVVHPLFRESRLFDYNSSLPLSPVSINTFGATRRLSVLSAYGRPYGSADAVVNVRFSVPPSQRPTSAVKFATGDDILNHSRPSSRHTKVQSWLEIGSPTADHRSYEQHLGEDNLTDDSTRNSGSPTTAARRQVSSLEGELVARTLLLQVPFFETSAKTGEQVEELFEAVVREVLREAGHDTERPRGYRGRPKIRGRLRKRKGTAIRDEEVEEMGERLQHDKAVSQLPVGQTFFLEAPEAAAQISTKDGQVAQKKARRESVLGRMRSVLQGR
jgi:GTPase SAR1 family protein